MKKHIALATLALLLSGCNTITFIMLRSGDPASAPVAVIGDYPVLGREPLLVVRKPGQPGTATWTVQSGAEFEGSGIRVDARIKDLLPAVPGQPRRLSTDPIRDTSQVKLIACATDEKTRRTVICTIPAQVRPGLYSYTVLVRSGGTSLILDPTFMLE